MILILKNADSDLNDACKIFTPETMALVRVPTFGPFRQHLLENRHSDAVENDGDKKEFDVGFSDSRQVKAKMPGANV